MPVEPEVHALDERVLRDDDAARELRRVVLDAGDQAEPLELGEQAELTELREPHRPPAAAPGSVAARITATPAAPARMHAAAFDASMPPIATTGADDGARRCARSSSSPSAGSASSFDGVSQIGPTPR